MNDFGIERDKNNSPYEMSREGHFSRPTQKTLDYYARLNLVASIVV